LGKTVSALQTGIAISSAGAVTGTLKYVTGYSGFSGEVSEQSGNYLALKFTSDALRVTLTYNGRTATLDSDMNAVIRVTDKTEPITITAYDNVSSKTVTLDLSGLTLEE